MGNHWDEFERLRRLVPERADWHLHNWGIWCRGDHLTDGFDERSTGLSCGGISGDDAFAHLCEPTDEWAAHVSDTIIDAMPVLYSTVLQHVYAASVFRFRQEVDQILIAAAAMYWAEALKRDLT